MIEKTKEKEKAIELRKQGLSYSEILEQVPVAKSTLSLWLRSVGLSKRQKQRLTKKKLAAARRGANVKRKQRVVISEKIKKEAKKEIGHISKRDLWILGIALYWGEGNKEKSNKHKTHGAIVRLGNSDPVLIKIFLEWLIEICEVPKEDIYFRIYLHETAKNKKNDVQRYWSKATGFPIENFQKFTWKKNKIKTNRKNIGNSYFGLLDIGVKKSTNFNRKIQGWIIGVCENCRVV